MVDGTPTPFIEPKQLEYEIKKIRANHGGLLYLNCECGEIVDEGQILGQIRNLKGEVLQELYSPADGVLDFTHPQHIQQPGNSIFGVRRILG
jgi:predicted deacylase